MKDDMTKVKAYVSEIQSVYKQIQDQNPKNVAARVMPLL